MAPESITVDLDHAKKLPLFEAWKDISGYEGLYRISNLGRVERMYKHGGSRFLKPSWRGRYLSISLSKGNRKVNATISRLVAMAFIPNPDSKPQVNHIDGNRGRNDVYNLEWATPSENTQHAVDTGLRARVQGVALQSQNGRPPWNKGKKTGQIPWNKSLPLAA